VSLESGLPVIPAKTLPRNRLILLRYVEGQSVEEIASYFELQPATINGILNSPMVRLEMEKLSQGSVARIQNLTDEAIDVVKDSMRGKSNSELKFKAANSLLDRNPELNPKKSEAGELMAGLGEGMIRAISKQLREMEKPQEHEIPTDNAQGASLDSGSDNG